MDAQRSAEILKRVAEGINEGLNCKEILILKLITITPEDLVRAIWYQMERDGKIIQAAEDYFKQGGAYGTDCDLINAVREYHE